MSGTLALGATKGITKEKAMKDNLLDFEDLENLKLAEDLAKTCFEMYSVTSTGLAPEISYFHTEVSRICMVFKVGIDDKCPYAHQIQLLILYCYCPLFILVLFFPCNFTFVLLFSLCLCSSSI